MIKLSSHEQKILNLIKETPEVLSDPNIREKIANKNGMSEKTLRNRIGDLKRYGLIDEMGAKENIEDSSNTDMQKNLLILWKKRWFIIKNVGFVAIASIIITLLLPKWYSSQAIILSSDAGRFNLLSSLSPLPVADFGLSSISEDINKFIAILNSRSVKGNMVKKFDLINRYDKKNIEYAMVAFEDKMELEVTEEGTLKMSVVDKDPSIAKEMVDELLLQLDTINQRLSMDKGRYNREFLERRLIQARNELAIAEVQLKDFQKRTGIIDIVSQISAQYEAYGQLYTQEMQAYTELFSLRAQTEVQLKVSNATLNPDNPTLKKYNVMLSEQDKQLAQITTKLDKHLQEAILGLKENEYEQKHYDELGQIPKMIAFKSFPEFMTSLSIL